MGFDSGLRGATDADAKRTRVTVSREQYGSRERAGQTSRSRDLTTCTFHRLRNEVLVGTLSRLQSIVSLHTPPEPLRCRVDSPVGHGRYGDAREQDSDRGLGKQPLFRS